MKYRGLKLQTLQDKGLILTLENIIRGSVSSVMGDRHVKSDENKTIVYADSTILYGHSMSEPLPYDETKFDKDVKLEHILKTPGDSDIRYFIEVDLIYSDEFKKKTKGFPFAPEN